LFEMKGHCDHTAVTTSLPDANISTLQHYRYYLPRRPSGRMPPERPKHRLNIKPATSPTPSWTSERCTPAPRSSSIAARDAHPYSGIDSKCVLHSASSVNNCRCSSTADNARPYLTSQSPHLHHIPLPCEPDVRLYKDYGLQTNPIAGGTGDCCLVPFLFWSLFPFALHHQGNFFCPSKLGKSMAMGPLIDNLFLSFCFDPGCLSASASPGSGRGREGRAMEQDSSIPCSIHACMHFFFG